MNALKFIPGQFLNKSLICSPAPLPPCQSQKQIEKLLRFMVKEQIPKYLWMLSKKAPN